MDKERNLLFGLLAAKWSGVDPVRLQAAVREWSDDPESSLPKRLVDSGVLSNSNGRLIWSFVKQAENHFDGNRAAALAAFGGEREVVKAISVSATASVEGAGRVGHVTSNLSTIEESPGRYKQGSELGRGGMGRVLIVHDKYLGRDVALKELLAELDPESDAGSTPKSAPALARFLREARVTGRLEHPSIVPVYELGRREDGRLYYTMKLVRGRTLKRAIAGAASLEERLRLVPHFVDLCQAIAYAHSHGVIHRDLKPANVMVGEFGETIVLDWGLAKVRGVQDAQEKDAVKRLQEMAQGESVAVQTLDGQVIGTPTYMSPEQAKGDVDAIDERSDVYALGVILYEVLTAQRAFEAQDVIQIQYEVIHKTPPSVLSREPGVPRDLAAICERAMEKDPDSRYPSVKELANEIERFQSGRLVETYEYRPFEHLTRFVKRHKAAVSTAAFSLIALVTIGLMAYVSVVTQRNAAVIARKEAEWESYCASITAAH